MARPEKPLQPRCLVLDSGAVIGLARGDTRSRAFLARALELEAEVRIPVAVLAETLRGGPRDAPILRIRNAVDVLPTPEATARLAGSLLGLTGGSNTVDALIAAETVMTGGDVLTGDAGDLAALLSRHKEVTILQL